MPWDSIQKRPEEIARSNLRDYDRAATFSWDQARALLDGLPGGGLNIAYEAVDRHVAHGLGDKIALRWIGQDDNIRDLTYSDLQRQTNKFANALRSLDIAKGDRVYCLLGRVPELYIAALGTLKAGAAFCPLFSAFGPEPIKARMSIGEAKLLVTTEHFYRRKIASGATNSAASACHPHRRRRYRA